MVATDTLKQSEAVVRSFELQFSRCSYKHIVEANFDPNIVQARADDNARGDIQRVSQFWGFQDRDDAADFKQRFG